MTTRTVRVARTRRCARKIEGATTPAAAIYLAYRAIRTGDLRVVLGTIQLETGRLARGIQGILKTLHPRGAILFALRGRDQFNIKIRRLTLILTRRGQKKHRQRGDQEGTHCAQAKKHAELLRIHAACPYVRSSEPIGAKIRMMLINIEENPSRLYLHERSVACFACCAPILYTEILRNPTRACLIIGRLRLW